jgi:hypothetical protein
MTDCDLAETAACSNFTDTLSLSANQRAEPNRVQEVQRREIRFPLPSNLNQIFSDLSAREQTLF